MRTSPPIGKTDDDDDDDFSVKMMMHFYRKILNLGFFAY